MGVFCSEKAVLSITLTSDSGEVLGFGAFYDYPGGKFYDPKLWEHEMVPKYGLDGVTVSNIEITSSCLFKILKHSILHTQNKKLCKNLNCFYYTWSNIVEIF